MAPLHDVVVVGAGAAGLMAATTAARAGARVVLLEKGTRPGLKILISGGGRCNLTTTRAGADLEREYGPERGRWLRHALRAFPPAALRAVLEDAGVPLQEEALEKVFPVSDRAADVLDALLAMAAQAGVTLVTGAPVVAVARAADRFVVTTPSGPREAPRLVLATGGLSYPKTGSTGDGYAWCHAFGHGHVPTVPHLAPLLVAEAWVHSLSGITLTDAELLLRDLRGRTVYRRARPFVFTHKGLSGPAAMDCAGYIEEADGARSVHIDFAPGMPREALVETLVAAARRDGRRPVARCLPRGLPARLREALVQQAGCEPAVAALDRAARTRLINLVKEARLTVSGSLGYDHAEVTRGGVPLAEVDPRTMQSRLVEGLYLCGEILDVDGPIGGYNFQSAFATGRLAGEHAGRTQRDGAATRPS